MGFQLNEKFHIAKNFLFFCISFVEKKNWIFGKIPYRFRFLSQNLFSQNFCIFSWKFSYAGLVSLVISKNLKNPASILYQEHNLCFKLNICFLPCLLLPCLLICSFYSHIWLQFDLWAYSNPQIYQDHS